MKFRLSKKQKGTVFLAVAVLVSTVGIYLGEFSHYYFSGTAGMFLILGLWNFASSCK
jgi:hypothetical protein